MAELNEQLACKADRLLEDDANRQRFAVVFHPTESLRARLRGAFQCRDFMGLKPEQLENPDADTIWLIADLHGLLEQPEAADRLARYAPKSPRFILLCDVDPLRHLPAPLRDAWTAALQVFRKSDGSCSGADALLRPTTAMMTAWWKTCDDDERRVLGQLALDGYTNPHPANIPAIKQLVERGFLRADKLTITSSTFADFVRHSLGSDEIRKWEDAAESSAWQSIKVPLGTGVAALLTALAASKPELGVASALVPLATVGLPSLLRILAATVSKPSG
jgi:hypothetical protein